MSHYFGSIFTITPCQNCPIVCTSEGEPMFDNHGLRKGYITTGEVL